MQCWWYRNDVLLSVGSYNGPNKRKNLNTVPGFCTGCDEQGLTSLGVNGTWTMHRISTQIDGKRKLHSCMGLGKRNYYYLPLNEYQEFLKNQKLE